MPYWKLTVIGNVLFSSSFAVQTGYFKLKHQESVYGVRVSQSTFGLRCLCGIHQHLVFGVRVSYINIWSSVSVCRTSTFGIRCPCVVHQQAESQRVKAAAMAHLQEIQDSALKQLRALDILNKRRMAKEMQRAVQHAEQQRATTEEDEQTSREPGRYLSHRAAGARECTERERREQEARCREFIGWLHKTQVIADSHWLVTQDTGYSGQSLAGYTRQGL